MSDTTSMGSANLKELRAGLGRIAARVSDDPAMARCCMLIDRMLTPPPITSGAAQVGVAEAVYSRMVESELRETKAVASRLQGLINHPEVDAFLRGTHIEAVHQVERWGASSDRAKRASDWFWLLGYLAGKALRAAEAGNVEKAKHHCISSAAVLYNWHCAISGTDVRMCPGLSDLAEMVESMFPGETTHDEPRGAATEPSA